MIVVVGRYFTASHLYPGSRTLDPRRAAQPGRLALSGGPSARHP